MAEHRALNSRQQRKIPRDAWKTIAARHQTGESLASIARTYECTPPAIGYIVRQEKKTASPPAGEAGQNIGAARAAAPLPVFLPARRGPGRSATTGPNSTGAGRERSFDLGLRETMTLEIAAFLVAFDGIVAAATPEAFDRLRDAADHLLRATARVRIELERHDPPTRRVSLRDATAEGD